MAYNKRPNPGQALMSASEPVTIASDQSTIPVSVSGVSTAANQSTIIGHVDGIEGLLTTIDADTSTLAGAVAGTEVQVDVVGALPAGNNNIGDVDVASVVPGTGASNLGKAEDAAHVTGDVGVMALAVRKDTAAASSGTTGDYEPLSTDATGRLWIVGAAIEDAAETAGGTLLMAGTVRRDTAASSAGTTGDNATLNTDSLGRLWISGAAVEDAAETAGGILLMAGSVRRDTAASSAGTTGDNATINTDSVGALWTRDTATQVDDAAFTPATGRVMPVAFFADETATDSVDEGDAGAARMTLDRKQIVSTYAHTAGGYTPYKLVSAATTNATSVKASAGTVGYIAVSNVNAAARYLKLYNKASAPTVGTDTPVHTFIIPGNTAGAGSNIMLPPQGIAFSTGIAFALTTEATDAGTTAVAANEIVVNLGYV